MIKTLKISGNLQVMEFFDEFNEENPFSDNEDTHCCKVTLNRKTIGFLAETISQKDSEYCTYSLWHFHPWWYQTADINGTLVHEGHGTTLKHAQDACLEQQAQLMEIWRNFRQHYNHELTTQET